MNRLDPRRGPVHLRRVPLARRQVRALESRVAFGGVLCREHLQDGGAGGASVPLALQTLRIHPRFIRRLRLCQAKLGDELAPVFPARERFVLRRPAAEQGLEENDGAVHFTRALRLHRRVQRRRLRSLGSLLGFDRLGRRRSRGSARCHRAGRRGLHRAAHRLARRARRLAFLALYLLVHLVHHGVCFSLLAAAPLGRLPHARACVNPRPRLEQLSPSHVRVPLVRLARDGLEERTGVVQGGVVDTVGQVPARVDHGMLHEPVARVRCVLSGSVVGVLVDDGPFVLVAVVVRRDAVFTELAQRFNALRLNRRKLFVLLREHPVAHAPQPRLRDTTRLLLPRVDRPAQDIQPLFL